MILYNRLLYYSTLYHDMQMYTVRCMYDVIRRTSHTHHYTYIHLHYKFIFQSLTYRRYYYTYVM